MSVCRASVVVVTALVVLSSLTASRAADEEQENPIVAQVQASVRDPAKPFTLIVTLQAKEGAGEQLEAAFADAIKQTRKEKGCLVYELNRDTKAPEKYLLYERWQSVANLKAHLKSRHIATLLKELADLLASPPEVRILVPAGE